MTVSEAVRRIKEHNRIHSKKERQAILITEALNMAVEVLEKQIPKPPTFLLYNSDPKMGAWHCPFGHIMSPDEEYCSRCGQKIDWSDIE